MTGRPVTGASITYESAALSASGTYQSDVNGSYFLPLLSTGSYAVRASAPGYQAQELQDLDLPVAGAFNLDFRLRPLMTSGKPASIAASSFPAPKPSSPSSARTSTPAAPAPSPHRNGDRSTLDTSQSLRRRPRRRSKTSRSRAATSTRCSSACPTSRRTPAPAAASASASRARARRLRTFCSMASRTTTTSSPARSTPSRRKPSRNTAFPPTTIPRNTDAPTASSPTPSLARAATHITALAYGTSKTKRSTPPISPITARPRPPKDNEHHFGYQAGGPILRNRLFFSSSLEQFNSHSDSRPRRTSCPPPTSSPR